MAESRLVFLNSNCAEFPFGRDKLASDFTFDPPLDVSGPHQFISVTNMQIESVGVFYELETGLEYADVMEPRVWAPVPDVQIVYFRTLDGLGKVLNSGFRKISRGDHPTLTLRAHVFTLSSKEYYLRFSDRLRRILGLEDTSLDRNEAAATQPIFKTSEVSKILPIYATLDCTHVNGSFPKPVEGSVKQRSDESVIFYIDLNPMDQLFESIAVSNPLWARLSVQSIQRLRLCFRYVESGRLVRTIGGTGDNFQVALQQRKLLSLTL